MTSSSHEKHAALARPALGSFGRREWALLGTTCDRIQKLARQLAEALSPQWKIAFVDADHKRAEADGCQPFALEHTDKIAFRRLDFLEKMDAWQHRPLFNGMDAVLVNGNHFAAKSQVVVIDPKKEDSLRRKLDRLTDVQLILLAEEAGEPWDFLKEKLPGFEKIPVFQLADFQRIEAFFRKKMTDALPPLRGLVLAGGKSQRMGADKSLLDYHGKPQRERMLDLLGGFCEKTFLSCRPDQAGELAGNFPVLPDSFLGLGPFGAILSAFREQPNAAWLVVACDLPLLDEAALRFLVENRNPSAVATAFRSPVNEFPEPLTAIWEPKGYLVLLQFLAQGYSCPRKVLINSPIHLLDAPNPDALRNANTPEEREDILAMMGAGVFK